MITESDMMHGRDWRGEDVRGWFASEKLDGVRAFWDGERLWTRSGREISIPDDWRAELPRVPLDGEVWGGRGALAAAVNAVKYGDFTPWIRFVVFDAPEETGTWLERLEFARSILAGGKFIGVVEAFTVTSMGRLAHKFREIRAGGGEGLMLRFPRSRHYFAGRTNHVLKVKKDPRPNFFGALETLWRRYAAA